MKRKGYFKLLYISVFVGIAMLLFGNKIYAASATITASKTAIKVGETATITIKAENAASWNLSASASGGTLSLNSQLAMAGTSTSGDNASEVITTGTFTAQAVGTYTISLSGQAVDVSEASSEVKKSVTITVEEKTVTVTPDVPKEPTFTTVNEKVYAISDVNIRASYSASSKLVGSLKKGESVTRVGKSSTTVNGYVWSKVKYNNQIVYIVANKLTTTKPVASDNKALQNIEIANFVLEPTFSQDVTKYDIKVTEDIEKLDIKAIAADSKSKVEITGNENLVLGENFIKITVTAENGTARIYNITVLKEKAETLKLSKLNIKGFSLSPAFSEEVFEYKVDLSSSKTDIKNLEIETEANFEGATVEVVGNQNFIAGENVVTILVTSADGKKVVVYQISVNKPEFKAQNEMMKYYILGAIVAVLGTALIIIIVKSKKNSKKKLKQKRNLYEFEEDTIKEEKVTYKSPILSNFIDSEEEQEEEKKQEQEENQQGDFEEEIFDNDNNEEEQQENTEKDKKAEEVKKEILSSLELDFKEDIPDYLKEGYSDFAFEETPQDDKKEEKTPIKKDDKKPKKGKHF